MEAKSLTEGSVFGRTPPAGSLTGLGKCERKKDDKKEKMEESRLDMR